MVVVVGVVNDLPVLLLIDQDWPGFHKALDLAPVGRFGHSDDDNQPLCPDAPSSRTSLTVAVGPNKLGQKAEDAKRRATRPTLP